MRAGPPLLYSTINTSMPAMFLKSSVAIVVCAPGPDPEKTTAPGLRFASAMNSCTDFASTDGWTTSAR